MSSSSLHPTTNYEQPGMALGSDLQNALLRFYPSLSEADEAPGNGIHDYGRDHALRV